MHNSHNKRSFKGTVFCNDDDMFLGHVVYSNYGNPSIEPLMKELQLISN